MTFKVFAQVNPDSKVLIHVDWSIDVSKEFNVNEFPIPDRNQDGQHSVPDVDPAVGFFRATPKEPLLWKFISDKDAHTYCSTIHSWYFDEQIKLFVLKRREGCQYLTPSLKHFHSLSESDLIDLGRKPIITSKQNSHAIYFSKLIHKDFLMRFRDSNEQVDETKLFLKPRKLKRIIKPDGTVEEIQRPVKCISKVPAKRWDLNILRNLDHWVIDNNSGEAKMYADRGKQKVLMTVYDPMQLVNLSRSDLRTLYDTECSFLPFWKTEENKYRKILRICLSARVHANSRRLLFDGN
jgi:hypothetical protein